MDDLPDYDIRTEETERPPPIEPPARSGGVIGIVVVLLIVAGVAAYIVFRPRPMPPAKASPPVAGAAPVARPLGGEADAIAVPPLDESDATVRTLVRALSAAPAVAAWLTADDLIRNFAVVVSGIAGGSTPRRPLAMLRPRSGFRTLERGGTLYVDPGTYTRYDAIADAASSIDPAAAAKLYATLKPRINQAYGELGLSDPSFDDVLRRAIVVLLKTPVVDQPQALVPRGIGYGYADDRLEDLSDAQKQLLRMGPRNARLIQERLRAIAFALGVAPGDLPAR